LANLPPVARISIDTESTISLGTVIEFSAGSSSDEDGNIASYSWDFGDGIVESGETLSHEYTETGSYTVTLRVTDNDSDSARDTLNITVTPAEVDPNDAPVASFTASDSDVEKNIIISFDASNSSDSDGTIASYFWDFGDENTATGVSTTHSYSSTGTYTVTLTVTDDQGDFDSETLSITVTEPVTPSNSDPSASFSASKTEVDTNESVSLDGSASSDSDGTIVSYQWDFGDGSTGTGETVNHSYTDDGQYTITLTVTDDLGATDTSSDNISVLNVAPICAIETNLTTLLTGGSVAFDGSQSSDSDGSINSYAWDFGDGTTGTGPTVNHIYTTAGSYRAELTITDDDNAIASAHVDITVSDGTNTAATATFTSSDLSINEKESVYFNASASSDSDGVIVSYTWDFGDGYRGSGEAISHTFMNPGTFTVTLILVDNNGAESIDTENITVIDLPNVAPTASLASSQVQAFRDVLISFDADGSNDSDGTIESYEWDFGDSTTASGSSTTHSYSSIGDYTVTLTLTDNEGAQATDSIVISIVNALPTVSFTNSAVLVDTGVSISFDGSDSTDSDGSISSYAWDFGDGNSNTGSTVTHSYSTEGSFTVTLTVTDNDGEQAESSIEITVANTPPLADAGADQAVDTDIDGYTLYLDGSGSSDADNEPLIYSWSLISAPADTSLTSADISNADSPSASLDISGESADPQDGSYTYTFELTISDGTDTDSDSVTIIVTGSGYAEIEIY